MLNASVGCGDKVGCGRGWFAGGGENGLLENSTLAKAHTRRCGLGHTADEGCEAVAPCSRSATALATVDPDI